MSGRTTRSTLRGTRAALATTGALTLSLTLTACGSDGEGTATGETTTAQQTSTEETTTAQQTSTEETTTAQQTTTEETSEQPSTGVAAGTPTSTVQSYVSALADGDTTAATAMLSAESRELLGGGGGDADVLSDEPWLAAFQEDAATFDHSGDGRAKECHWNDHEAWAGSGADVRVVELTCWAVDGGRSSEYGFGARLVDGAWVVDQDRIDTSTGGAWVEFVNPDPEGAFSRGEPVSFAVATGAATPEHLTLRGNSFPTPLPLEQAGTVGDRILYTQAGDTLGAPGAFNLLVSGRAGDSPMVRAHGITFGITESS